MTIKLEKEQPDFFGLPEIIEHRGKQLENLSFKRHANCLSNIKRKDIEVVTRICEFAESIFFEGT